MKKVKSIPIESSDWQAAFKGAVCKVGFQLNLSRLMLEYLCAISDDVKWDRPSFGGIHCPDNWYVVERCLEKRGLIRRKPPDVIDGAKYRPEETWREFSNCELTPAGECVVKLVKISGMFLEADAAISKKARRA